jgi:hypothetical protein
LSAPPHPVSVREKWPLDAHPQNAMPHLRAEPARHGPCAARVWRSGPQSRSWLSRALVRLAKGFSCPHFLADPELTPFIRSLVQSGPPSPEHAVMTLNVYALSTEKFPDPELSH